MKRIFQYCESLQIVKCQSLIIFVLAVFLSFQGIAQYSTTADTLNCNGGTTTFVVDLSANPDSLWLSPPQIRAGDCCGTDNNCVQFVLTLSPQATGINFLVPDGCGATPTGSLFYQVDCGPLTSVGDPICLDGAGPFVVTFCKPGNNENCYSIQSIPAPSTAGDVITADGCSDTLSVTGLEVDSISWNSLSPGLYGEYNDLLTNTQGTESGTSGSSFSGYDTVIVTPGIGGPSVIQYEVCGIVTGFCLTENWCDTVSVNIYPTLFAEIQPNQPAICEGGVATTITANPIGGTAPYSYVWSSPNDPALEGATSQSIDVTVAGEYSVIIMDITGCPYGYDTVIVIDYSIPITVDAGSDLIICSEPIPSINLNGSSPVTGSAIWSNYDGSFSTNETDTSATYTPSINEINNGQAVLILNSQNNLGCPGTSDTLIISLTTFISDVSTTVSNISCYGAADGSIDLTVSGGNGPFTYDWSTGDNSEDINGLSAANYSVMITDNYGCTKTEEAIITEPSLLIINDTVLSDFNGYNISCYNGNNGSIDISVEGGTTPYTYNWTTSDGSGIVVNSEDQNSLSAGSYTVTVTDANGCEITQTYVLDEPTVLELSTSVSEFPSGDNISCYGFNDGSINLNVTGGTPGYNYDWSTLDGSGLITSNEDQSGLTTGSYAVTITDINGCILDTAITLTQPDALQASLTPSLYPSGDNISCFGFNDGSIDLDVTGGSPGYNFDWSTLDGSGLITTNEDQSGLTTGSYAVTITEINGCVLDTAITLTQPDALQTSLTPSLYPSGDNISCYGFNDGSIDLDVTGGSPGYSFDWSAINSSGLITSNEDQSGLIAGSYAVTITDINGCILDTAITLTQPDELQTSLTPSLYPSGDNISCFGFNDGAIDLDVMGGSPGYNFDWSTSNGGGLSANNEDQTGLISGSYAVTITDINGCILDTAITLIQPTALQASLTPSLYPSGDNISCFGFNDGSIDLDVTGGSPDYNFDWSTINGSGLSVNNEDQTGIISGTYEVTITDINGCILDTAITLTQPDELQTSLTPSLYPSGDNISCFGFNDGSIDLNVTGGSPIYNFDWSTLDGSGLITSNEDQSGLTAGSYAVTITDINGCALDIAITLTQPDALQTSLTPSLYPSGDNISCFGFNDGSIDLDVTGGTPGYNYDWGTLDGSGLITSNEDQSGLTTGSYAVTITDINGCVLDTAITLTQPDELQTSLTPSLYPSGDNISCFGFNDGSIDLNVTGGSPVYNFDWSTINGGGISANNEDQTGIISGTYEVTITDINGCILDTAITLTQPDELQTSLTPSLYPSGDNISCFGFNDGSIDLNVTGGSPVYNFDWSTLDGSGLITSNEDQSGLTAGSYAVTITDINGCALDNAITLTQPDALQTSLTPSLYPSGDNISCFGFNDGSIDLNVTGGSPGYSFDWSTINGGGISANNEDQTGIIAGSYSVTITDINGCILDTAITLTQPDALQTSLTPSLYPSGDNISCFGFNDGSIDLNVTGGSPGYSFDWSTVNGGGLSANNEDQTGIISGTYEVTITDINGCQLNNMITLEEPELLEVAINVLTDFYGQAVSCVGENDGEIEAGISGGSPNYSIEWNNNPNLTSQLLSNLGEGSNSVLVTDTNGCVASATVELEANPVPEVNPSPAVSACLGETVTFSSNSSANEYCQWTLSNGMVINDCGPNTINLESSGCYNAELIVTNQYGCTNSMEIDEFICIHPNPNADFTPSAYEVSLLDNTLNFQNASTGAIEFEWYFGDGSYSNENDPIHSFPADQPGEYVVTLYAYNEFGCMDTSQKIIKLLDELLFFVPNTFTPDGNEFNNEFKPIFGSGISADGYELHIYNRWGQLVFESRDISYGWNGTTPTGSIAQDGTYTWSMTLKASEQSIEKGDVSSYTGHLNLIR